VFVRNSANSVCISSFILSKIFFFRPGLFYIQIDTLNEDYTWTIMHNFFFVLELYILKKVILFFRVYCDCILLLIVCTCFVWMPMFWPNVALNMYVQTFNFFFNSSGMAERSFVLLQINGWLTLNWSFHKDAFFFTVLTNLFKIYYLEYWNLSA
jgi:hypothetical protein